MSTIVSAFTLQSALLAHRRFIGLGSASTGHWPINRRCGHKCAAYDMAGFGRLRTVYLNVYRPAKLGLRFSMEAARPSLASSLWKQSCCNSRSIARASESETSEPDCTERLMRPTVLEALLGGQNWRA